MTDTNVRFVEHLKPRVNTMCITRLHSRHSLQGKKQIDLRISQHCVHPVITKWNRTSACGADSLGVADAMVVVDGGGTAAVSRTVVTDALSRVSATVWVGVDEAGTCVTGTGTSPGYGHETGVGPVTADGVLDPRRVKATLSANRLCSSRRRCSSISGSTGVDMVVVVWYSLLAPAATPREIIMKLAEATVKAAQSPELKQRLTDMGAEPVGHMPDEAAKFLRDEIALWATVVKSSGAHAD